jgi:hypothetical protein
MKPFSRTNLNHESRVFNYRLSRARRIVENAFGILAARWRIFLRPMLIQPDKASLVTMTAILLHNYLRSFDEVTDPSDRYITPLLADLEIDDGVVIQGEWRAMVEEAANFAPVNALSTNNYSRDAASVRNLFKEYFLSPVGTVPWQERVVNRGRKDN